MREQENQRTGSSRGSPFAELRVTSGTNNRVPFSKPNKTDNEEQPQGYARRRRAVSGWRLKIVQKANFERFAGLSQSNKSTACGVQQKEKLMYQALCARGLLSPAPVPVAAASEKCFAISETVAQNR